MGRQGECRNTHHLFRPGLLPTHDALLPQDLPYSDRIKYAEVQKEKPGKGFGTSDFSRRDEFSNTCRTEQYRTQLKVQTRHADFQSPVFQDWCQFVMLCADGREAC